MIDIQSQIRKKVGLGTLFVKGYITGDNFEIYKEFYERYQYLMGGYEGKKNNTQDFSSSFTKLIDNFKENGYDKSFPIVVSREGIPIDGHHRVACCLYFGSIPTYSINPKVSIKNYNGLSWILNNPFVYYSYSDYEKILILKEYCKYNKIYYYDSIGFDGKNTDILGKFSVNYKGNKSTFIFTQSQGNNNKQSRLMDKLLHEKININDIYETPYIPRGMIMRFYHFRNRLQRKIFEFIKKYTNEK